MGFWHFLWTVLVIYVFFVFLMIFFQVVFDLFRSRDLSGWAKAGWVILLVVLPLFGVLIYLLVRHEGMAERAVQSQLAQADRVRASAGAGSPTDEIAQARELLDAGVISTDEFEQLKQRALI